MPKVFVAGHRGMVGSAICREIHKSEDAELVTIERNELDLLDQNAVSEWFSKNKPDQVYLAAAKVGGILANSSYPAEFIYQNLVIETNLIQAAHMNDVQRLLFLGSSCIYPKNAAQPMREESLLTGTLEPTNEPYAIAKIAGIKLCESYNRQYGRDYRSVMPTNLYGPNDNFQSQNSHVIPALIQRFHNAVLKGFERVVIWGSGEPRREFMHVNDLASACIYIMNLDCSDIYAVGDPMISHINVGTGLDCSIRDLAILLASISGFSGIIEWDSTKPDGMPRKLLDISRMNSLGWEASISLGDGLRATYDWYLSNIATVRR